MIKQSCPPPWTEYEESGLPMCRRKYIKMLEPWVNLKYFKLRVISDVIKEDICLYIFGVGTNQPTKQTNSSAMII